MLEPINEPSKINDIPHVDFYEKNNFSNELILHPSQCQFLWNISWLSLGSGLFALYQGYYDLAIVPLSVWCTSINYWRHPDFSWRRYLDIGVVHLGLFYQSIRAIHAQYCIPYFITLSVGLLCFPISVYLHKKHPWISTLLHGMVHIFGNISNIILYSGEITNFQNSWTFLLSLIS